MSLPPSDPLNFTNRSFALRFYQDDRIIHERDKQDGWNKVRARGDYVYVGGPLESTFFKQILRIDYYPEETYEDSTGTKKHYHDDDDSYTARMGLYFLRHVPLTIGYNPNANHPMLNGGIANFEVVLPFFNPNTADHAAEIEQLLNIEFDQVVANKNENRDFHNLFENDPNLDDSNLPESHFNISVEFGDEQIYRNKQDEITHHVRTFIIKHNYSWNDPLLFSLVGIKNQPKNPNNKNILLHRKVFQPKDHSKILVSFGFPYYDLDRDSAFNFKTYTADGQEKQKLVLDITDQPDTDTLIGLYGAHFTQQDVTNFVVDSDINIYTFSTVSNPSYDATETRGFRSKEFLDTVTKFDNTGKKIKHRSIFEGDPEILHDVMEIDNLDRIYVKSTGTDRQIGEDWDDDGNCVDENLNNDFGYFVHPGNHPTYDGDITVALGFKKIESADDIGNLFDEIILPIRILTYELKRSVVFGRTYERIAEDRTESRLEDGGTGIQAAIDSLGLGVTVAGSGTFENGICVKVSPWWWPIHAAIARDGSRVTRDDGDLVYTVQIDWPRNQKLPAGTFRLNTDLEVIEAWFNKTQITKNGTVFVADFLKREAARVNPDNTSISLRFEDLTKEPGEFFRYDALEIDSQGDVLATFNSSDLATRTLPNVKIAKLNEDLSFTIWEKVHSRIEKFNFNGAADLIVDKKDNVFICSPNIKPEIRSYNTGFHSQSNHVSQKVEIIAKGFIEEGYFILTVFQYEATTNELLSKVEDIVCTTSLDADTLAAIIEQNSTYVRGTTFEVTGGPVLEEPLVVEEIGSNIGKPPKRFGNPLVLVQPLFRDANLKSRFAKYTLLHGRNYSILGHNTDGEQIFLSRWVGVPAYHSSNSTPTTMAVDERNKLYIAGGRITNGH